METFDINLEEVNNTDTSDDLMELVQSTMDMVSQIANL